jgi:hypothetical protein
MTYAEWKKVMDEGGDFEKWRAQKGNDIKNPDFLKISGDAPEETKSMFEKEFSLIPENHQKLIEKEIQEVCIDFNGNSRYDRAKGILYLDKTLDEGEAIHEMAHALETSYEKSSLN